MTIEFGHASHVGQKREHNEDAYGHDPASGIFVVADGMGRYASGGVASAIAVNTVLDRLRSGMETRGAVLAAHEAIKDAVCKGQGAQGMGTTIVVLLVGESQYEVAWVGDSRAYLIGDRVRQLTRDHSLVQRLVDDGTIQVNEAATHPQRNVITQALGLDNAVIQVDTINGRIRDGEKILICSDGLYGEVDDSDIFRIINMASSPQRAVEALIDAANKNGGSDNITALLVDFHNKNNDADHISSKTVPHDCLSYQAYARRRKKTKLIILCSLLVVICIYLLVLIY